MKRFSNFKTIFLSLALISVVGLTSCSEDDAIVIPSLNGFFILNEGSFGNSNTSLSYFDEDSMRVTNNLFQAATGRPLGDQSQSMTIFDLKGFIVVQNSGKVEVIDALDFSSIATIDEDVMSPRYFIGVSSDKGYLSDWGDGFSGSVKVIDLNSYTVTNTIPTGAGANQMLLIGDQLYVTNSGGFGNDNKVSIIDTNTDEVTGEIVVGDNPGNILADAQGNLWVLSGGAFAFDASFNIDEENSTPSSLSKISGGEEVLRLDFPNITFSNGNNLNINPAGDLLYYTYEGNVFQMSVSAEALPTTAFISKSLYGLSIHPVSGQIIGLEAPDFSSAGNMIFYDANGNETASYIVGIAPNGCAFE